VASFGKANESCQASCQKGLGLACTLKIGPVEWAAKAKRESGRRESCKKGKNDRNSTPEELESSIFATGKRRLTIRPRSKALLAMLWQEEFLLTPFLSAKLPKSKIFRRIEYKTHN
jgi:hypothetical protein